MTEKTLKFNNIRVNKEKFQKSKEPIDLMSVNIDQIVISGKLKHNEDGFKYLLVTKKMKFLNHYVLFYLK